MIERKAPRNHFRSRYSQSGGESASELPIVVIFCQHQIQAVSDKFSFYTAIEAKYLESDKYKLFSTVVRIVSKIV